MIPILQLLVTFLPLHVSRRSWCQNAAKISLFPMHYTSKFYFVISTSDNTRIRLFTLVQTTLHKFWPISVSVTPSLSPSLIFLTCILAIYKIGSNDHCPQISSQYLQYLWIYSILTPMPYFHDACKSRFKANSMQSQSLLACCIVSALF